MARTRQWRRGITWDLRRLKHTKPVHINNESRLESGGSSHGTSEPQKSQYTSATLTLDKLPPELTTKIFSDVVELAFQESTLSSYTYNFIPIRHLIPNPLMAVCRSLRTVYIEFFLHSRWNRGRKFIGVTTEELVTVHQWFKNFDIQGCLLFLGDPNQLLVGPLESLDPFLGCLLEDPEAMNAVEAVEWEDPSTSKLGVPPDILEDALVEVCREFRQVHGEVTSKIEDEEGGDDEDEDDDQGLESMLVEELVQLSLTLCSKIVGFLKLFPNLKTAEIPAWILMLAWSPIVQGNHPQTQLQQSTAEAGIVRYLGERVVSQAELNAQLEGLTSRLDGLMITGYPFVILGVFLFETQHTKLQEFNSKWKKAWPGVGRMMEGKVRTRFQTILEQMEIPNQKSLQGLRGVGWRSNCRTETVNFDRVLEKLFRLGESKVGSALEELYGANRATPDSAWDTPLLASPIIDQSTQTLRRLVLDLRFPGSGGVQVAGPPHQCLLLSKFDEILPNIEHIDVSVDGFCIHVFEGQPRPRIQHGTFILTARWPAYWDNTIGCPQWQEEDEGEWEGQRTRSGDFFGEVQQAGDVARILKSGKIHFERMDDWEVQFRLQCRTQQEMIYRFRNQVEPLQNTLILFPLRDMMAARKVKKFLDGSEKRWVDWHQETKETSARLFGQWAEMQGSQVSWLDFPWGFQEAPSEGSEEGSEED